MPEFFILYFTDSTLRRRISFFEGVHALTRCQCHWLIIRLCLQADLSLKWLANVLAGLRNENQTESRTPSRPVGNSAYPSKGTYGNENRWPNFLPDSGHRDGDKQL